MEAVAVELRGTLERGFEEAGDPFGGAATRGRQWGLAGTVAEKLRGPVGVILKKEINDRVFLVAGLPGKVGADDLLNIGSRRRWGDLGGVHGL